MMMRRRFSWRKGGFICRMEGRHAVGFLGVERFGRETEARESKFRARGFQYRVRFGFFFWGCLGSRWLEATLLEVWSPKLDRDCGGLVLRLPTTPNPKMEPGSPDQDAWGSRRSRRRGRKLPLRRKGKRSRKRHTCVPSSERIRVS